LTTWFPDRCFFKSDQNIVGNNDWKNENDDHDGDGDSWQVSEFQSGFVATRASQLTCSLP
jgi:hypothetical protein